MFTAASHIWKKTKTFFATPWKNPITKFVKQTIENEFHVAISAEKTASTNMPRPRTAQQAGSSKDPLEMISLEQPSKPPRQKAKHQLSQESTSAAATSSTAPVATTSSTTSTLETVEEGVGESANDVSSTSSP